jgi:hypothetical protein
MRQFSDLSMLLINLGNGQGFFHIQVRVVFGFFWIKKIYARDLIGRELEIELTGDF